MNKKLYRGLGVLAILLIGTSLGLLIRPTDTGSKNVYIDVDPSKEVIDQMRHQASKDNPPTARPGYKMVRHGDHYHEVPISELNESMVQGVPVVLHPMKDVPEHLKMPPEWYNFHYMEAYENEEAKKIFQKKLKTIIAEVIENYNPKRPIEDVWPAFIEAEKDYNARSPYNHLNPGVPGLGGYRGDWLYKQVWDFPEVFKIILYEEPAIDGSPGMWLDVYQIETGLLDPDWNRFNLPDGRVFRARDGYKYQFNLGYDKERGIHRGSVSFCRSHGSTAKLIVIDLDTISDEELEQLSGRDYNINPYTGKPIAYPGQIY